MFWLRVAVETWWSWSSRHFCCDMGLSVCCLWWSLKTANTYTIYILYIYIYTYTMYNIYLMYIHYFCSLSWYFLHPRAQLRMPRSWQRTHVPPNQTAGTSEPPRSPPLSSSGRRTMQNSLQLSYRNPTSNLQDIQFSWLLRITKSLPCFQSRLSAQVGWHSSFSASPSATGLETTYRWGYAISIHIWGI